MTGHRTLRPFLRPVIKITATLAAITDCSLSHLYGQDVDAGIEEANTMVRQAFTTGTQLMYAVGAVLGLIGAVKVYQKWNSGDPDTGKVAAAWFGSCIFLVIVATVIQSFFGI